MKVLITGSNGFIGRNLIFHLKEKGHEVLGFDLGQSDEELLTFLKQADFIIHLAGINRPLDPKEFEDGNVNFTKKLLDFVKDTGSLAPIIFSSSTQAEKDNPYGVSKRKAEEQLFAFKRKNRHPVYVFRLYNVYGKWCRPNYNSVIATWCYNIARDIPISINEAAPPIDFVYIDDVCSSFIKIMEGPSICGEEILYPEPHDTVSLKEIADLLYSFKGSRSDRVLPLQEGFAKKLYATYLSYLPEDAFSYPLDMHVDNRGSFTELVRTPKHGQVSLNVGHPGITKGNHYHHTKNEKFIVIKGTCEIAFRKIDGHEIIRYVCSGDKIEVVDIPPGYTHSIKTVGDEDSLTIMWANELFDPDNPDTYPMKVEEEE